MASINYRHDSTSQDGSLTGNDLIGQPKKKKLEGRREPRTKLTRRIEILPASAMTGSNWQLTSVELVDCSLRGVGFIADAPMNAGEQFLARLDLGTVSLLLYTVRHCSSTDDGKRFRIGAEFTRVAASPLFHSDCEKALKAMIDGAKSQA
jgi:hypothetical protein